MLSEAMFQRFTEKAPVTVMVRSLLERVLSRESIDAIFANSAIRQVEGELLFSSVVELLTMVVWRQRDSINQAYKHAQEDFEVSIRSVYNKLNGTETQVCRALVHQTATPLEEIVAALGPRRKPQLPGYQTRIIDGNHLTSTDHRLKVLRTTRSGPLPGQALVVLDPDRMLMVDLFPCEDGQAQERRILPEVIPTVQERDLWIADRNFCTTGFLFPCRKIRPSRCSTSAGRHGASRWCRAISRSCTFVPDPIFWVLPKRIRTLPERTSLNNDSFAASES
jgi:hypothetical protein